MNEALKISGIGIFIVFFALVFISITITFVGKLFTRKEKTPKEKATETSIENATIEAIDGELSPEIIAVITAAVSLSYGPCVKISSIGVLHRESQYGRQGRMNIMSSHKLK